jgi:hypothetical protein
VDGDSSAFGILDDGPAYVTSDIEKRLVSPASVLMTTSPAGSISLIVPRTIPPDFKSTTSGGASGAVPASCALATVGVATMVQHEQTLTTKAAINLRPARARIRAMMRTEHISWVNDIHDWKKTSTQRCSTGRREQDEGPAREGSHVRSERGGQERRQCRYWNARQVLFDLAP